MEHIGEKWSTVEQNGAQPIQCRFFEQKNDSTKQEYRDVEYILLILWWSNDKDNAFCTCVFSGKLGSKSTS